MRALRAGRGTFDPFGALSSDGEESDDLADVEAGELNSDDERAALAKPVSQQNHWEFDAAELVLDDAAAPVGADPSGGEQPAGKQAAAVGHLFHRMGDAV